MKFNYKTITFTLLLVLPILAGVSEQFGYSKITGGLLMSIGILVIIALLNYLNNTGS